MLSSGSVPEWELRSLWDVRYIVSRPERLSQAGAETEKERVMKLFWATIEGLAVGVAVHFKLYGIATFLFAACVLYTLELIKDRA